MRKFSILLIAALLLTAATAPKCGGGSEISLEERAVRAVAAVPSVVRTLFPNADPKILDAIDGASTAFSAFLDDRTADGWGKAKSAWNAAKPLLQKLSNQKLNSIIAAVDILISQVFVSPTVEGAKAMPVVRVGFKEADVKRLEQLVK